MAKYVAENCFDYIDWYSVYIEKVAMEENNLFLSFEHLELVKEHSLNPFNTEWGNKRSHLSFL